MGKRTNLTLLQPQPHPSLKMMSLTTNAPLCAFLLVVACQVVELSLSFQWHGCGLTRIRNQVQAHEHHHHHHHQIDSISASSSTTRFTALAFSVSGNTYVRPINSHYQDRHRTATRIAAHSQHTRNNADNDNDNTNCFNEEYFSVAPMMGHTNRHYRYFFRLLSKRAHLYTEMIPSSQIVRAFKRARTIYLKEDPDSTTMMMTGAISDSGADDSYAPNQEIIHPEQILELMHLLSADPSKEYTTILEHERDVIPLTLHQLLSNSGSDEHPSVLQLGGRNPEIVGLAAAIGSVYGMVSPTASDSNDGQAYPYVDINLNCGCPSNAVGGRSGGCALMKEPETVARCVEEMNEQVSSLHEILKAEQKQKQKHQQENENMMATATAMAPPRITVKHRLGVRDASTFDGTADRKKNDDEAFEDCSSFIRTVSMTGAVPKFHVHARLGLLGEFKEGENDDDNVDDDDSKECNNGRKKRQRQTLWVPGSSPSMSSQSSSSSNAEEKDDNKRVKIDHKREQLRAKKRARKATLLNRDVPPLRPNVAHRIAAEFPNLDLVSNGGIKDFNQVKKLVDADNGVLGAMVGRSAINHPCSFAGVDALWDSERPSASATNVRATIDKNIHLSSTSSRPTRGEVLSKYIQYCNAEEICMKDLGASAQQMEKLRKRLIAVPFHLFTGEDGSDAFQRRIKKLRDKTGRLKASSILSGAASFVPVESLNKRIDDFVSLQDIEKYEIGMGKGSAMQRVVH